MPFTTDPPMSPRVRAARASEAHIIAVTLAEAALGDPLSAWLIPGEGTPHEDIRFQHLVRFFRMLAEQILHDGELMVTPGLEAAALWNPRMPGRGRAPIVDDYEDQLRQATEPYTTRFMTLDEHLASTHPADDHWYLIALGVRPERQRRGFGSDLLAHMAAMFDAADTPAAVHAYSDGQVAFYRRHGFQIRPGGPVTLPAGGPTAWPMWRPHHD